MAGTGNVEGRVGGRIFAGQFEVDMVAGELYKSGRRIALQEKPFCVLRVLLQRPGELVTREDLHSQLWSVDTHVGFDEGLNTAIRKLRTAFGDSADNPRFIETVPRRGYRFIAPVSRAEMVAAVPEVPADVSAVERSAPKVAETQNVEAQPIVRELDPHNFVIPKPRPRHWLKVLAAGLTVLVLTPVVYYFGRRLVQPDPKTIAVLPFQNAGADKDIDFLRFALSDQISAELVNAPSISIRPSAITSKYVGDIDLQRAGRQMRVPIVVTGHYLKAGEGLEVVMEAVDVGTNKVLWRDTFVSTTSEAIALSDQVTGRVRRGLLPALGVFSHPNLLAHPHNEHAYDAYLRSLPMSRDPGVNRDAITLLERSVSEDPDFAPAWEALGLRYNYAAAYQNGGRPMKDRSEAALERALALDPDRILAAGQLITSWVERRDSSRAYAYAQTLAKTHPASAEARWVLSYVERYKGDLDASARECNQALALDPGNVTFRSCAWTFLESGNTQRARSFLALDAGSDWAAYVTTTALLDEGKIAQAREQVKNIAGNPLHFRDLLGACLQAQPAADLDNAASQAIETLRMSIDPEAWYFQGAILAYCGKPEPAVRLIGAAISANYCARTALQTDPLLSKLRDTQGFSQLATSAADCDRRFTASR